MQESKALGFRRWSFSVLIMRQCEVCKKKSQIQKSGAHQYGGGWAMRATKKRAVWQVNLHSAKVTFGGVRRTMRLCTKCLRRVRASSSRHSEPFDVIAISSEEREKQSQGKLSEESKKMVNLASKVKEQTSVATA